MRQDALQKLLTYTTGSIAVSLSFYTLATNTQNLTIAAASTYFILITYTDCRYNKIPNIVNASLVVVGISINVYQTTATSGILFSLAGLALGISLLLLPFLAGGFGAGDVKALGALGALLGPYVLLHVFAYMGIIGGVLAILYNLCGKALQQKLYHGLQSATASFSGRIGGKQESALSDKNTLARFPYATAIAFGYFCFVYRGGII